MAAGMRNMAPETRLLVLMLAAVGLVSVGLIAIGISRGALSGYFAAVPSPHPSPSPSPLTPSPSPTPSTAPTPSPPEPPPSLFVRFTGSTAGLIAVVTLPGASCKASAVRPDGSQYDIPELRQAKTADGAGKVGWNYSTTGVTTGSHVVTCSAGGKSDTATMLFGST